MASPPSPELAYLRARVEAFEAERQDLLQRLDACAAPASEVHRLRQEARLRAQEVTTLQKALSDAHTYLFDERERLLALQAENDQLRLQEAEDRSRIKQLLGLTRPVEQALVYPQQQENAALRSNTVFPRQPPQPHPQHPPRRGRSRSPGRGGGGNGGGEGGCGRAAGGGSGSGGERILRTVYLPAAQTEPLALKCEALKAQLVEQRRFNAERMAALAEDRQLRERDMEAQMAATSQTISDLEQRLRGAEEALRRTTKDYILARQQKDASEAEAVSLRAQLAAAQRQGQEALQQERERAAEELGQLRESLEVGSDEAVQALRAQLQQREDELLKLETVHKLIRQQLEGRAAEAEARAARLARQAAQQGQRRALDMEGWVNDVTLLRKQIAAVDRRLRQQAVVGRLRDDERRDAILDKHYRMAPSVAGSEAGYDEGMDQLISQLSALKCSLLEMGQRVQEQAALDGAVQ